MKDSKQIPKGYKPSPFGLIPNDWDVKELSRIFEFKNGINAGKESYGNGVKFINVMEVIYNSQITPDKIPGYVNISDVQKDLYLVKYGDVLFNRTSETTDEIGLTAVYEGKEEVVFGGFVIRARPIDDTLKVPFRRYCFRSKPVRDQIITRGQGAVRSNIGQGDLEKVVIPVPPHKEQTAITNLLSKWDKAINTLTQLIAQKELCKKWLMQQLLTGKKRLKGFKGEWEDIELSELLEYEQPTKYLVKDTFYNDSFSTPVLTAGKTFILGYTNEVEGICTDIPVIIFDDFTTASKYVDFPFKAKSSAMKLLRPKSNANLKFVYESMQLMNYVVGGHERHWISKFVYLTIPCPSIEEQTAIAMVLKSADNEIKLLREKLEQLKDQKKGLMQLLLTGKKRLKI